MAALRSVLIAALVAAVGVGVGIGIGAAIWEGSSSSPPAAAAPASYEKSWLFAVNAGSGVVTATGGDALTILLRGAAPTALAFTDRPALEAQAVPTPDLAAGFAANAPGYADGLAPPNAALSFAFEGAAVLLPVEILNVTGAAPDYTFAARALGQGGVPVAVEGGAAVEGTVNPLWAAMGAGLEVAAPVLFIDNCGCWCDPDDSGC